MREAHWLPWERHGARFGEIDGTGRDAVATLGERIATMTGIDAYEAEEAIYRLIGWMCREDA